MGKDWLVAVSPPTTLPLVAVGPPSLAVGGLGQDGNVLCTRGKSPPFVQSDLGNIASPPVKFFLPPTDREGGVRHR